ncbi:DUF2630 family protein [Acidimicrobiales bacterium]|nr:DUF2630 family protein [bacterium]MDC1389205.1 DUF2630 family protein [Acidimicrobiales bacterium]
MEPNLHDLVTRLLAEEAHLIGQEVQDASNKRDLDRLAVVSGELDGLADLFRGRRPRPHTHTAETSHWSWLSGEPKWG